MFGAGFLRCFFLIGVMSWYTTSVWKTIDQYFRDQFRDYLQKEFESNEAMKRDLMLEAEKQAARKALINKIKGGFSESNEERGDLLWSHDHFGHTATEVPNEFLRNEYIYSKALDVNLGQEGYGDAEYDTLGQVSEGLKYGMAESPESQCSNEICESEGISEFAVKEQHSDENFKTKYATSEDECSLDECKKGVEGEQGPQNWQKNFLEDEDVCRLEDLGEKDSCGYP